MLPSGSARQPRETRRDVVDEAEPIRSVEAGDRTGPNARFRAAWATTASLGWHLATGFHTCPRAGAMQPELVDRS